MSRHHAVVIATPSGHYIVDLNSKNGLTVNGEEVTNAVLGDGDVIVLGPYRLKVAIDVARRGDPRPSDQSLSATATVRVKELSSLLDHDLRSVKVSPT